MNGTRIVASVMLIGLIGCGDGGAAAPAAQPAAATTAESAATATATKPITATSSAAPVAPLVEEGQPGYDQSLRGATAAVSALFAPYLTAGAEPPSDMDPRPDYSAALNRAIAAWRAATVEAGATALSDAGWVCGCQDWDAARARLTIVSSDATDRGYNIETLFSADGSGPGEGVRFVMIEEAGRWKVDDMIFVGSPANLRAALAQETRTRGG
jgi:hypothetical protein